MEENKERRDGELDFVVSAYSPDEAWCETDSRGNDLIVRRLDLPHPHQQDVVVPICVTLTLPCDYPVHVPLEVSAKIDTPTTQNKKKCPPNLQKLALNALPHLVSTCRQTAIENEGEESVLLILNQAEEWIQEYWLEYSCQNGGDSSAIDTSTQESKNEPQTPLVLGRRLIYSHHIISKIKRADIKHLASDYSLTGYMKIGWPGLILVEGNEEDCTAFYDEIRPWCWQYLVVRGEQQESIHQSSSLDSHRKFNEFLEVNNMSTVACHCREAGLEALFRTSMKVYGKEASSSDQDGLADGAESSQESGWYYGALVHIDHMNDGKSYRKWLRKTSRETDCFLLIKQCYPNEDYSNRPKILVAIVGDRGDVSAFLKRWRTSRVDVDIRGKPCLERKMTVAVEGVLDQDPTAPTSTLNWEATMFEDSVTTSESQLVDMITQVGGPSWNQVLVDVLRT